MNHYSCGGTLDIDIDHAGLYTGFSHDGLNLPGDVVQAVEGGGGYLDGLLHAYNSKFYTSSVFSRLKILKYSVNINFLFRLYPVIS